MDPVTRRLPDAFYTVMNTAERVGHDARLLHANTAAAALVEFLRPIPSVALIPLAALVLGSGPQLAVALGGYAAVWPVLFNTVQGLAAADPVAQETLRAFGFGRWSVLWRLRLPGAGPFIATGVRLASSVVLVVAVSTEILSGRAEGIGGYAAAAETGTGSAVTVLACAVWAGLLGLLIDTVLVRAGRRAFAWHHARGGNAG